MKTIFDYRAKIFRSDHPVQNRKTETFPNNNIKMSNNRPNECKSLVVSASVCPIFVFNAYKVCYMCTVWVCDIVGVTAAVAKCNKFIVILRVIE